MRHGAETETAGQAYCFLSLSSRHTFFNIPIFPNKTKYNNDKTTSS
jgi:hypothetical protein